jgi:hypothetical protein
MFKSKHNKNERSASDTTTTHWHEQKQQFNPGRFSSALTEQYYPKGFGAGGLGVRQIVLVEWLRKKHGTDEASMDLADRLDGCKPNRRCPVGSLRKVLPRGQGVRHQGCPEVFG